MTPADLERIRAHYTKGGNFLAYAEADVLALADALEQAWSWHERDSEDLDRMRERAERAEAQSESWRIDADAAHAALDRVRGLCAEQMGCDHLIRASDIRAAIEGDQQ